MAARTRTRNTATLVALFAIVAGMGALAYASVPLYRWFCQVTGYGGTTQVADAAPVQVGKREITVRFNADVNPRLPWKFEPAQGAIRVRVGAESLAFYRAENRGDAAVTGTAVFNVTPLKAGPYFNKIQCFCFDEQTLAPGQSVDMPVSFFIDPEIANDRGLDDVETITLSYTFFKSESGETPSTQRNDDGSPAVTN